MTRRKMWLAATCLLALNATYAQTNEESTSTWKPVEAALGRPGQLQSGGVYKFAMPRKDMKVVKDGVTVAPGLALGSWLAFKNMGTETMVMGDLVLTEDEIERLIDAIVRGVLKRLEQISL